MAKAKFTYSCGHEGVLTGGSRREVDYRAGKKAAGICWDCEKAAENAQAQAAAEAAGLAALTGSPKQIAYGTTMRARHLPELDRVLSEYRTEIANLAVEARQEMVDALIVIEDEIRARTDAAYWIEAANDWSRTIWNTIQKRGLAPRTITKTR